jgi:diguanylate cyclase (GGDEF)-like protein/PAS domain S-box-containing protein
MVLTSLDGRYVQVNRRFADMLGYTPEEMKGMPIDQVVPPEDREGVKAQRLRLIGGEVLSGERRFLRKDGRVIWVRRTISPARDPGGNTLYYVSVAEDITATKQREEHYRAMFQNAAVGITRVDLNGVLVDVNQKFCDMLGYTQEELAGKEIRDITHPDDFGQGSRFRAQLAHGQARSASGEKRFVRKDGAVIWARRTMSTVSDEAGNPRYVISVVEDITERKELERRFELTFNHAAVGMTLTGLDGRLMQVNQKYADMLGYARDELRGMASETLTHADDVAETVRTRDQLIEGRVDSATGEKRLNRKDRSVIWVRRSVSVARGAGGEPLYFITVVDDITDRKEAAERYRSTFEHAPVGIMHTSIEGDRILHANSKLCEMLGYTSEEIVSLNTDQFIHPTHVGVDQPRYREQMLHGEVDTFSSERLYRRKDGSDLWVDRTVSLARDSAGKPLYFIRIIEDISGRKRAQEAVASERALLRTIIDTVPDYIYVKDGEGRFQLANKAWLKERGHADEEIAGKTVFEVFSPPELAQRMAAQDAAIVRGGEPMLDREQLVNIKSADGKHARAQWTSITKVPMRDASGNIIGTVGISRDITEQKLTARRRDMEHAVTRVLSESESLDTGMTRILQTICEGFEWASGAYWQWDEAAELLRCVENWHIDAEGLEEFAAASRHGTNEAVPWRGGTPPGGSAGGLIRAVWQSGAPVWFPDIEQRPDFRRADAAAKANLHCAFGFPILAGGLPLGIMEFYGQDIKEPDEALLQIVRAIGSQIGQFIQKKGAEQALRLSEERHRDQFEASPLPMWVWDDQTLEFLAVNQAAVAHYGYSRSEFLRMTVRDIWVADEGLRYDEQIRDRSQENLLNLARRHRTKDGRIIDVEATARRFVREGRHVWLTLVNDVSVRLRAERALQESEEQFRQLANNIPQVFWITDVRQKETLYLSPATETLLGWPLQEIRDNPRVLVKTLHHEDRSRVYAARKTATAGGYDETYRIVRPDGSIRWVHDRAFPVRDPAGAVYRIAGIAEDITERKLAEERLLHLAHYDVLTSLPNRVLFYDRLRQALAQAKRNEWVVGVMLIDVDRFKNVNDTLGHAVGDQLLQQVSERLTKSVRSGDTVGRLGGDEFAVVLSNLASAQDGSLVAQKIMASFKEPFRLAAGGDIYVTASIGITLYPNDSTEQDALIKNADAAMYRAKESGRNAYRFYTPEMNARAQELLSMENSMRRALAREEFLLHYQPKVSVVSGEIVGLEALLRWRHPERGLVSPGEFMPVLEETGLIVPVGEWVIGAVCEQIALWQKAGIEVKPVAVNLSARQFADRELGTTIKRIIEENGIDAQLVDFEITESSVMTNTEDSTRVLEFLGQLGVGLSIDDFGTGYSSLGYLKRFPLDALKIDRSFVRDITTSTDDATITRAVISMAHSLGLKVIAEGVETEEQLTFLAEHGCDEFQGYLFSRPLPADDCGKLLREKRGLVRVAQTAGSSAPIVLLVDDDGNALTLLKHALAKDSYRILTACNAHEGLELLGKYSVDLVISDQNMPGIPGVEFLRRVGTLFPNTTRMMTSALSAASIAGSLPGVDDAFRFLPKDMSEEELRAGVREALQRKVVRRPGSRDPGPGTGN